MAGTVRVASPVRVSHANAYRAPGRRRSLSPGTGARSTWRRTVPGTPCGAPAPDATGSSAPETAALVPPVCARPCSARLCCACLCCARLCRAWRGGRCTSGDERPAHRWSPPYVRGGHPVLMPAYRPFGIPEDDPGPPAVLPETETPGPAPRGNPESNPEGPCPAAAITPLTCVPHRARRKTDVTSDMHACTGIGGPSRDGGGPHTPAFATRRTGDDGRPGEASSPGVPGPAGRPRSKTSRSDNPVARTGVAYQHTTGASP